MLERMSEVFDSPTDWVAHHVRRYVESDGADGHSYNGWPTLLLTVRGRRSGKLRRTALIYGRDADRYLVVASNGGAREHPEWYRNLLADPDVGIQVGRDHFVARARTADAMEVARLWPVMAEIFPLYEKYRAATDREIPLVILEEPRAVQGMDTFSALVRDRKEE